WVTQLTSAPLAMVGMSTGGSAEPEPDFWQAETKKSMVSKQVAKLVFIVVGAMVTVTDSVKKQVQ
ncbi:MAG TPA: hypothetical protein PKG65_06915, partial [Ferruginibacter sp.]|nr:hypothetical protein [Ferruginibacter sp.]